MHKKTDVQSRGVWMLCLALLLPLACLGTSIVRVSLEEAVSRSEWIVSGDVVRNWCGWDNGHRLIWTFTEIAVRDKWKGTLGSTVTVAEPGGTVDHVKLAVTGMVRYSPGEHVVLFLYRTPIGLIRTVGVTQGKLLVDDGGVVHPSPAGAPVISAQGMQLQGTSLAELEGIALSAAQARIAGIRASAHEVRK